MRSMEASGSTPTNRRGREKPADADGALRRYPQPQPEALRVRLAEVYGVHPEQLLIGRGSDEAIDLLVRALCRAEPSRS